jgi:hypothetical protein
MRSSAGNHRLMWGLRTFVLCSAVLTGGCQTKASKNAAPSASVSTSAAKPAVSPDVDLEMLSSIVGMADSCKVDVAQGILSCSKGEERAIISKFATNQRSRVKAIPTFTAALKHGRQEVRAVGASLLHSTFASSWGPDAQPGAVPPAHAEDFLSAVLALGPAQLRQALPAAVHASTLSGRTEGLHAALGKLPPESKPVAYRHLMTHGRLQAFEKVKTLANDKETAIVLAAIENPRNMNTWTDAEQAAICPWAVEFLKDTRPVVVAKAAGVLSSCSGEHIDRLLDMIDAALTAKTLFTAKISAFRDLCLTRLRTSGRGPTEAQCNRARKLLEDAAASKALDAQSRGMALVALAHQWPDARTLALAKRFETASEKVLAEHAGRVVQRVGQVQRSGTATKSDAVLPRTGAAPNAAAPIRPAPRGAPTPPPEPPPAAAPAEPAPEPAAPADG